VFGAALLWLSFSRATAHHHFSS
jgi:hypothetical protein